MTLNGCLYTFVIVKNNNQGRNEEPYLYFISDLQDAMAITNHYLKRWKIECCFKHLKRNGFNIEDINLKADIKIELMMGILACTYIMAVAEGIIQHKTSPPKMKSYKNGSSYPAISIFRTGYNELQRIFQRILNIIRYLEICVKNLPENVLTQKVLQNV